MDLNQAEELFAVLSDIVDYPLFEDSPRINLSATLSVSSMQFAAAVRVLCEQGLVLGASTALRSQFESMVRSVWALHRATDLQVKKLSAELNLESQQASNGLSLLAFINIGILTGQPGIQTKIVAATVDYSDCLPQRREYI